MDCDESSMQKTLQERKQDRSDDNTAAIAARIHHYKYSTLPVIAHYDDADKLYIVSKPCIYGQVHRNLELTVKYKETLNLRSSSQKP